MRRLPVSYHRIVHCAAAVPRTVFLILFFPLTFLVNSETIDYFKMEGKEQKGKIGKQSIGLALLGSLLLNALYIKSI